MAVSQLEAGIEGAMMAEEFIADLKQEMQAAEKMELELKLEEAQTSLSAIEEPFNELIRKTEVRRLVHAGYGTSEYEQRWYNLQFYADWKEADEIVEIGLMTKSGGWPV